METAQKVLDEQEKADVAEQLRKVEFEAKNAKKANEEKEKADKARKDAEALEKLKKLKKARDDKEKAAVKKQKKSGHRDSKSQKGTGRT